MSPLSFLSGMTPQGLLLKALPYLLVIAAFAGFYVYHVAEVGGLQSSLTASNKKVGVLQQDNARMEASIKSLTATIHDQNDALDAMLRSAREQQQAAKDAMAKVVAEVVKWQGKYKTLLNQPAPPKAEECVETAKVVDQYYELRQAEHQDDLGVSADPLPPPTKEPAK